MHIVLIDRDPEQLAFLRQALQLPLPGQDTRTVVAGLHPAPGCPPAEGPAGAQTADAVVADWRTLVDLGGELPGVAGPDGTGRAPVLVLLPRDLPEAELSRALRLGAQDYAAQPASPAELRWRLTRLVVRPASPALQLGDWTLRPDTTRVCLGGRGLPLEVALTDTEFRLLSRLMHNLGQVVPRHHLIASATLPTMSLDSRTLDTHIYRLRRKLPLDGSRGLLLQSIYCRGYRLSATQASAPEAMTRERCASRPS
ncbi:response regulator transcription factor [Pseudacidovorax intermedius]|uniref:OmpR/PhoB-type domain-containing protein n=1 Tax=Pseudacidovorax intermedius TaxID=433924 RepID=A0A147GR52_9BURK|nr:response regulator transcription factor [Pseudacidovorax intermedius]KTT18608.1 hypothetical protein NS331_16040 [Pseudacidovorax intermedius]